MIASRLSYLAETRGWLTDSQAGFRRGRSCEDQVICMTQSVSDGFQRKKPKWTVMMLLDFSWAYDRVWRQELLGTMMEKGVPRQFLRWIAGFLRNRQGRVQYATRLESTCESVKKCRRARCWPPAVPVLQRPARRCHPSRCLKSPFRRRRVDLGFRQLPGGGKQKSASVGAEHCWLGAQEEDDHQHREEQDRVHLLYHGVKRRQVGAKDHPSCEEDWVQPKPKVHRSHSGQDPFLDVDNVSKTVNDRRRALAVLGAWTSAGKLSISGKFS